MKKHIDSVRHALTVAIFVGVLTACTSILYPVHAQSQNNIPVIVMGEDEDRSSVGRKSDIFKRVLAELKDSMLRHGFRIRDEEMIAVDLGWKIVERRPKTELIEAAKLANQEAKGNLRSRALALFRIHANSKKLSYTNKVETRIAGELYDLVSNEFLGSFELPKATYSAPHDCNRLCITEIVGRKGREIAAGIGDVLGKKLAYLSPVTGGGGTVSSVGGGGGDSRCGRLQTSYTVTLRRFNTPETLQVINTMAGEFPCYQSHDLLPGKTSAIRKYEYVSRAKAGKLEEWLSITLMDMGLNPDKDVEIILNGSEFILDKIITRPTSSGSIPERSSRFK